MLRCDNLNCILNSGLDSLIHWGFLRSHSKQIEAKLTGCKVVFELLGMTLTERLPHRNIVTYFLLSFFDTSYYLHEKARFPLALFYLIADIFTAPSAAKYECQPLAGRPAHQQLIPTPCSAHPNRLTNSHPAPDRTLLQPGRVGSQYWSSPWRTLRNT